MQPGPVAIPAGSLRWLGGVARSSGGRGWPHRARGGMEHLGVVAQPALVDRRARARGTTTAAPGTTRPAAGTRPRRPAPRARAVRRGRRPRPAPLEPHRPPAAAAARPRPCAPLAPAARPDGHTVAPRRPGPGGTRDAVADRAAARGPVHRPPAPAARPSDARPVPPRATTHRSRPARSPTPPRRPPRRPARAEDERAGGAPHGADPAAHVLAAPGPPGGGADGRAERPQSLGLVLGVDRVARRHDLSAAELGDVLVEGRAAHAEEPGDRGDRVLRAGEHRPRLGDLVGVEGRGPAEALAAGPGGGQAVAGALDEELAQELREGGEDVEDQATAGGGGVEALVQGPEPDPARAELADEGHELGQRAGEPVEPDHDQGVPGDQRGQTGVELRAGRPALARGRVDEHAGAAGVPEGVALLIGVAGLAGAPGRPASVPDHVAGRVLRLGREKIASLNCIHAAE